MTLGQSRQSHVQPLISIATGRRVQRASEVASIEARCRRKAEAARWVAESQRRLREGTEYRDALQFPDQELASWAESLAVRFYWKSAEKTTGPIDVSVLDDVAGCFETVAESLALAAESERRAKAYGQRLPLVAEAQSALRRSLQRLDINDDSDQMDTYEWLRTTAAIHRVYLRRHMRADDLAEPSDWPALLARIEEARAGGKWLPMEAAELARIREHQERICQGVGEERDWHALIEGVARLVGLGMPSSRKEFRDLLLPIIDDVPDRDDWPDGFRLALQAIDRYLATRSESIPLAGQSLPERSAEVQEVARLLKGRSVVLIGGSRRREAQHALQSAFELAAVFWIETREHESFAGFEPLIARPEVALVMLAIRWSSHGFGEVRHLCDKYDKPLVRLPGGYSPNQVAAQILTQCSQRLRG